MGKILSRREVLFLALNKIIKMNFNGSGIEMNKEVARYANCSKTLSSFLVIGGYDFAMKHIFD